MASRFTGRDRMRKVLKLLPQTVRKQIRTAVLAGAEDMAGTMRRIVKVHSGKLHDSIKVTPADQDVVTYNRIRARRPDRDPELAAIIHVDAFYTRFDEFGTRPHQNAGAFKGTENPGAHAQPFFFPSYRARKKDVQARINRAARQGIKDGLK